MRIVVLTQYFPPDPHGWIPDSIAKGLRDRGHDVKVLTTYPHYTTGRIAEGYKQKLYDVQDHEGIQVRRVPLIPSHSTNPIGRIANYLSFAASAAIAKSFVKDADLIYVNGAPATVTLPAQLWLRTLGIPFVYHVQDIWPESVSQSGFLPKPVTNLTEKAINSWLTKVYSSASAVVAIAPTAKELLVQRGVPDAKCHVVFNWANQNDSDYNGQRPQRPGLTLLYAGNLGPLQDLDTVIRAAHKVSDLEGFRLLIVGSGVHEEPLKKLVHELGVDDIVQFLGRRSHEETAGFYTEADFQVIPLKDRDFLAGTIPSKFQAGLANGLPPITTVKGDVARLVEEHDLGLVAQPEDVNSLANSFRKAYETSLEERHAYSRRARAFYESHMSKASAIDRIDSIVHAVAGSN